MEYKVYPFCEIAEDVVIFPGAVLGREPVYTRGLANQVGLDLDKLRIGSGSVVGANAVIYQGSHLGNDVLVGDCACIREEVKIGDACVVAQGVTINRNATIGNRVRIMDLAHVTGWAWIGDDVFIGPHVSTTNDNSMDRSKPTNPPTICNAAKIGAGARILPGVVIGVGARVGAGAVVTRDVPPGQTVMGMPARIV